MTAVLFSTFCSAAVNAVSETVNTAVGLPPAGFAVSTNCPAVKVVPTAGADPPVEIAGPDGTGFVTTTFTVDSPAGTVAE
ncbi:hypothetical protein D3C73_1576510 [compost metagenome]